MSDHLARFVQNALRADEEREVQLRTIVCLEVLSLDFDTIQAFYDGMAEQEPPSDPFAVAVPESIINQQVKE